MTMSNDQPLGTYLKTVREAAGLSLRQVQERTDGRVKNAYLSQVETGEIRRPSPEILWHLATAYRISYGELLGRAGHRVPESSPRRKAVVSGIPLSSLEDLNEDETAALLDYISYLRHRRRGQSGAT